VNGGSFGVPRVGVDLVLISRAEELIQPERGPALFRMLRPEEITACTRQGRLDPSAVAGFLAVKEAVFKLFHQRDRPVPWRSMRVEGGAGRWPVVHLDGTAAALAEAAGLSSEISVSLAHDGAYAVAVAAGIAQ
jgi:holo-[acyl-carrier protein] synthase